MPDFAANLRRLMARQGLTVYEVVEQTGLDDRTVKNILKGNQRKPHARTLHQLATGLGVATDELFQSPAWLGRHAFDRLANPLVDELAAERPELFADWAAADFADLSSRFGAGGALTHEGALRVVEQLNERRELLKKVTLLLETDQSDVLRGIVEVLYREATVVSTAKAVRETA